MLKKNKIGFMLDTDWVIKDPIDFEHKQYVFLDYLQKVNKKLDKLEVYPSFIELSLHFANIQTLIKENKVIRITKKFETVDDEILISDLEFIDLPIMSEDETNELKKILSYTAPKIFDLFNVAKSIWQMAYESVSVSLKFNRDEIINDYGFLYYQSKSDNKLYVWEYKFKKIQKNKKEIKQVVNLIYSSNQNGLDIKDIIFNFSKFSKYVNTTNLPIFEVFSSEEYPLNETLLPLFKRKIQSYIAQSVNVETYKKISQ